MIDLLLQGKEAELVALGAELATRPRGDRKLVSRIEAEVAVAPLRCINFSDDGLATVNAAGARFSGGRFSLRSIGQLRAAARPSGGVRARFSVLCGSDPLTDIAMLQAHAERGTLFQVASQFNCLEAPGPGVVSVQDYFGDSTQGPRASISAFPGTLVRHYAAPAADGTRFVQTDERQLNLLAEALAGVGRVQGGYLMTQNISNLDTAAKVLHERFDEIRVGVHDGVPVVLGNNWDGPVAPGQMIAQAFTSTLALGGYSEGARFSPAVEAICRSLLRGAYLGTLLGAAALKKRRVVLTMIGGGVFGNPHELIWDSILWALDQVDPLLAAPLDVVLNGREVKQTLSGRDLAGATAARGGVFVEAEQGRIKVL